MGRIHQFRDRFMQLSEVIADRIVAAATLFLCLLGAAKAVVVMSGM